MKGCDRVNIIDDLIDKGLIKQTLKEEEVPLLWYTQTSIVNVAELRKCLGGVLHDMFTVLPSHCGIVTPITYIINMLKLLRFAEKKTLEDITTVLVEAAKKYNIEASLVEQVVQLAELNYAEIDILVGRLQDYDYNIFDYDELVNNVSSASDGNIVLYPVQVYVLLFTLLIGLVDNECFDKYTSCVQNLINSRIIMKHVVAGIHKLLTRDGLPIKDIIYSLWNTYIDMVARNCHITVEGGEV